MERSFKALVGDLVKKPPVALPVIGFAHLVGLVYVCVNDLGSIIEMLQIVWMLAYTLCWLAACDLRKWGAWGYIALTILNACIYLSIKDVGTRDLYMSNLFLADDAFSALLLFFFSRFS